ncbi:uncharacterized protein PGTG_11633 [Puccinia graminis f. sp. tritici CRL 75-36-700-3]|uniref:Uncharacterized protein n=1 Tax=Puccinia graminis f. sp. tritici (strain CRL 75-36-700-3 / race SCCL) TaxID=418459 RepID=E3KNK2_PUCGT|nr:uncharacterized protein PGTG_11633 [Puccinia graminis f. sp. tritici CRL 75-36-700-3]EFP85877.2 hypothetical protein PGTG_11633 [Puccinia graminis f. sp. tritici CRL 75-36-700-3]
MKEANPLQWTPSSSAPRPSFIDLLKSLARRSKLLLFCAAFLVFLFFSCSFLDVPIGFGIDEYWEQWTTSNPRDLLRGMREGDEEVPEYCYDPYRLPGYVERSELPEGPISSVSWNANDPSARGRRLARPNGVEGSARLTIPTLSAQLLANPQASELEFLRNRTVVFIGDSLDRNEVYHLAQETFGQTSHRFLMPQDLPLIHSPAHHSHRIGIGAHPELGFSIANWFLMSVDIDLPTTPFFHPDEDPPQNFEARFEKFYEPLIYNHSEILTPAPDLVVFNSGLWDLVFLSNRKDYQINQNRTQGIMSKLQVTGHELLSKSEIELHSNRFKKFLNKLVFDTFNKQTGDKGTTRFVYRTMPDSSLTLAKDNAMSRKRVRQIDRLNLQLILDFNRFQQQQNLPTFIDVLDWKWVSNQLLDELIDLVHFGRGAAQWLYGDMVLYYLRRHVIEQEIQTRRRKGERRRREDGRLGGAKTGGLQETSALAASLVWKDCRRFAQLVSSLNSSSAGVGSGSSFKLPLSRSLFHSSL